MHSSTHIPFALSLLLPFFLLGACDRNTRDDGEGTVDTAPMPEETPEGCEGVNVDGLGGEDIVEGHTFEDPVYLDQAPGNDQTLYVVERAGRILRVEDGELLEEPFLDIAERVDSTSHQERGLLGLAFHPEYRENGRFFVYYTPSGETAYNVVAEYRRSEENPELAATEEVRRLVEVIDKQGNHNGGMITFGEDGYLFVGMGDGGGAGDRGPGHSRQGNGQDITNLFGAILRLDVDAPDEDFVPEDNPLVGREGADEIWSWGLRNPWRFSFDRETGDLYIADVGQNEVEEINYKAASEDGGTNYGWRAYEADRVFDESLAEKLEQHEPPIVALPHGADDVPVRGACSITGGYVYRGEAIPKLQGVYLYGDYCSKDVGAFRHCDGKVVGHQRVPGLRGLGAGLSSFGEGNDGELYLIYHGSGHVKRLVSRSS